MAITFTKEQRAVIEARDCTTLVSAAAGSGKTAVLVQRIIEKLLDLEQPQEINRLLVVTYTNAAAAEMRERIGKRLTECLATEDGADNAHLQKQVLLLRNAPIQTIHGFCLSLLREFFYLLDLDPAFRVGDEAELTLLRGDVLEELLEECYEIGDALFLRLTECVGTGKNDNALVEHLNNLYRFSRSAPFPERFFLELTEGLEALTKGEALSEEAPCMVLLKEHMKAIFGDCLRLCRQTLELCYVPGGPATYGEAIEADEELFRSLCGSDSYQELAEILSEQKFAALSRKKCDTTEEQKEQVKACRERYKKMLQKIKSDYFYTDLAQMEQDMAAMAPLMQELVRLCGEYSSRFAKAKEERGIVDFDDLEHLAIRLLVTEEASGQYTTTETAKLLRSRFDEVMVDECQDSNRIQDLLLWSISGEEDGKPNRFMVGDVKQSIYKFRMAKPELFMQKYEEYENEGPYRKIVLGKNFRSRGGVVRVVNDIFEGLMQKEFGGIAYDEAARLYPGAEYPWETEEEPEKAAQYTAELLFTELEAEEEEDDSLDKVTKEAMTIGAKIKRMIAEQLPVYDGKKTGEDGTEEICTHPVEYRDIMILLRSLSGTTETYLEVFGELGIPVVTDTRTGYFSAPEVTVVLNALRVIDNPTQDIPLVSVLRSEMVGLTEEELALVRIVTKQEEEGGMLSFYEAVKRFLVLTETEETVEGPVESARRKLLLFEERFGALRALSVYAGVPEVLTELYRLTEYPDFVRVKPAGERRTENLAMLTAKARAYEESSYSGIFDFVRYIERLEKYEVDSGEAGSASTENAVRILSIHKSKGLEAPVVIVAGLSKKFNKRDAQAGMVLHPELGIGMDFKDEVLRIKAPTLYKKVIAGRLNYEMLSEELRIFYVALTRAREKLILSTTVTTEEAFFKKVSRYQLGQPAGYLELYDANSYLDFLAPVLSSCMEKGSLRVADSGRTEALAEEEVGRSALLSLLRKERFEELSGTDTGTVYEEGLAEELEARAAYCYPYPLSKGKTKLSVSELKKAAYEEEVQEELFPEQEPEKRIPRFLQEKTEEQGTMSGSERGTLYHRVMECMDFTKDYPDTEAVLAELLRLTAMGRLRKDVAEFIAPGKLLGFFKTELGARMQAAARKGLLYKEQPFVIGLPYSEVYKEEGAEQNKEYVMVQGIIDAFFEEDGALVLVDYKTDAVKENVREELTKRYRTQMEYYDRALRQITGKDVKERLIFAFTNGEAFSLS